MNFETDTFVFNGASVRIMDFPGSSDDREYVDICSISGLGRSPGEENGYSLVFLLGEFYGQRSLASYCPRGCKESNMTEQLTLSLSIRIILTRSIV